MTPTPPLSNDASLALKLERVARIELASSAWKAEVLPLNYTRLNRPARTPGPSPLFMVEGGGFEPPKLTRQIYSLIPLTAREPLQKEALNFAFEQPHCQS